jgi:L-ribulose-5-phosphate 3-epimerase
MMRSIGIMQGRLVPPVGDRIQAFPADRWRDEFPLASRAGLDCIEWIYETYGEERNPIRTDDGLAELRRLARHHGVLVRSICADYFMEQPLIRAVGPELQARVDRLRWLIDQSALAGIERIVIPFVDASEIRTSDEEVALVDVLWDVAASATRSNVELHLETSLGPRRFAELLERLPAAIRVNYDSGNSASLGYSVTEEFAAYGERIGSVHVKDRVRGGTTVPLGTGETDFESFFAALRRIEYGGDLILQVARDEPGKETHWARQNREFVAARLS